MIKFLIILLLSVVFVIGSQSAYADTIGQDYSDFDNHDGTHTFETHFPYVFDGNGFVPFVQSGKSVNSTLGNVVLNNDGSFTWNSKFTDRIVAKYSDVSDQVTWTYPSTLNNATPDLVTSNGNLTSIKTKTGIGKLEYKYIFQNGKWKTQLEATNLSSLTTKVFGFDQIIDLNSDSIKFGGVTRNLDNFNGTVFGKAFLDSHEGQMLDLLNGVNFDFDLGYENLYSVTVYDTGINSSRLVFDYRTNTVLMPNQKLVIDPTFSQTTDTFKRAIMAAITSTSCSTTGDSIDAATRDDLLQPSNLNQKCTVFAASWDTSAMPAFISITSMSIDATVSTSTTMSGKSCEVVQLDNPIAGADWSNTAANAKTQFDKIKNEPTKYYSATACNAGTGTYTFTLNSNATADFTASHSLFDAGFRLDTFTRTAGVNIQTSYSNLDLNIVYVAAPPPDPVDDLTYANLSENTLDLLWTQPALNNGTLQGYTINYTTPWGTPSTFLANTTNTYYNVTGLTGGTQYSFRVSAATNGGYNVTGVSPLNVTTTNTPDGTLTATLSNIGDTIKVASSVNITSGSPLPVNITGLNLYKDNVLVKTSTVSTSIASLNLNTALSNFWYRITDSLSHEYAFSITAETTHESAEIFAGTNTTLTEEYNPTYIPALESSSTQGSVNATVSRYDDEDGINLKVNRIGVSTGDTWQIECISQTNTQAASTKNQSQSWSGTWSNTTNTGYFNTTWTGFTNSHAYITCFNEDELFTFTSFTNSSLAFLGIQLFDESYGSMLGVPVGIFFLVMTAGMANKRTAPTWIIVLAGMAGTMATIGFFSFEPIVWGLALVTAMLGIFVNQKIF